MASLTRQAKLASNTRVDESDQQAIPTLDKLMDLASYVLSQKSRGKFVNHSCQLVYS